MLCVCLIRKLRYGELQNGNIGCCFTHSLWIFLSCDSVGLGKRTLPVSFVLQSYWLFVSCQMLALFAFGWQLQQQRGTTLNDLLMLKAEGRRKRNWLAKGPPQWCVVCMTVVLWGPSNRQTTYSTVRCLVSRDCHIRVSRLFPLSFCIGAIVAESDFLTTLLVKLIVINFPHVSIFVLLGTLHGYRARWLT